MLDVVIIAIGKIKEDFYREAFKEYLKRLSPYARIKIEELKAEPFKSDGDKIKSREIEGERIGNLLNNYPEAKVFVLDERGHEWTSVAWAQQLQAAAARKIIFVIGGTVGLSDKLLRAKNIELLSLSKMTLPHELARVIWAEQLYRAVCISRGKDYHY